MRLAASLVLFVVAAPALAGSVTGTVGLLGKKGKRLTDSSDAVVWIEGATGRPTPVRASMKMRDKAFVPHLLVVPTGSTVDFPNEDVILHNVFSVSGDNRFDLDLYKKPRSASRTFQTSGLVRVYCNIHPQMNAIVLVLDTTHFARTAIDGSFRIEGVAPGRYTVRAWHERAAAEAKAEMVVPETGSAQVNLTIDTSRYRQAPHKNKHGEDYPSADRY